MLPRCATSIPRNRPSVESTIIPDRGLNATWVAVATFVSASDGGVLCAAA